MTPRREAALVRPDRGEPGQPPDETQGKGHDITRSCTLLPAPQFTDAPERLRVSFRRIQL